MFNQKEAKELEALEQAKKLLEDFCNKIDEPYPTYKEYAEKILKRAVITGYMKQHEADLFLETFSTSPFPYSTRG